MTVGRGRIAPELAGEFPGLALLYELVAARAGRSDAGLRERLRLLSDGMTGGAALELRRQSIPHAYRVFFRHVGVDPDVDRTPIEEAAVERLLRGAYVSRDRVSDALLIALVETGVPAWALDADAAGDPAALSIRPAGAGERLGAGPYAHELPRGRLVVAGAHGLVAPLFGPPAPQLAITKATRRVLVFAVQVPAVPALYVDEALFTIREALA